MQSHLGEAYSIVRCRSQHTRITALGRAFFPGLARLAAGSTASDARQRSPVLVFSSRYSCFVTRIISPGPWS